eukprot:9220885-Pyramimonas_sp.AAC.1
MVRQEVHLKRLSELILANHPDIDIRIHRARGAPNVGGSPICQVIAGVTPEAATRIRWSGAAAPAGIPVTEHDTYANELAAAFADPMAAVQWLYHTMASMVHQAAEGWPQRRLVEYAGTYAKITGTENHQA